MSYVIKSWKASNQPIDNEGNYVEIVGRRGGLIAWIMATIKIDPTMRLRVGGERIEYNETSIEGFNTKIIPLSKVSSTFNSYHRPLAAALTLFGSFFAAGIILGSIGGAIAAMLALVIVLIGAVSAVVYYLLNRSFRLRIFEDGGGRRTTIGFKPSVIENVSIDQEKVQYVCLLIQQLIEVKEQRKEHALIPQEQ